MRHVHNFSRGLALTAFVLLAWGVCAEPVLEVRELAGARGPEVVDERDATVALTPVRSYLKLGEAEMHRLGPLGPAETEELSGTGLVSSTERTQVGIVRTLTSPVGFFEYGTQARSLAPGTSWGGGRLETLSDSRLVWTSGFSSAGAGAVRLVLEDVVFPEGAIAFVYGRAGAVRGPYPLSGDVPHDVWTHTVFADEVFLEVQLPGTVTDLGSVRLAVNSLAHLEHEWFAPSHERSSNSSAESLPGCFRDVSCVTGDEFPGLEDASRAVAQLSYRQGTGIFVCTGGLLNTTTGTSVPYLLTANHCVATAASAASLEAFWDYRTSSCGETKASRNDLKSTLGATLLATGSKDKGKADFTLLRLSEQPPAGRYYLGWSAEKQAVAGGAMLYRISHPEGGPQTYSSHRVSFVPTPGACSGVPAGPFLYSKNVDGATKGGSSGSPLLLRDGLKVVGQLHGRCGRNLIDECDAVGNSAVDGSFAVYFDEVKQWLAPSPPAKCAPSATKLCLTSGKFLVELMARDLRTGRGAKGTAFPQNEVFGYFSLPELTGESENPEVFVKIIDGRELNGRYWVFYGGLTDLELVLTVTDVETGSSRIYTKDGGDYCGGADTTAF
jgi:hypothetical protein